MPHAKKALDVSIELNDLTAISNVFLSLSKFDMARKLFCTVYPAGCAGEDICPTPAFNFAVSGVAKVML